MSNEQSLFATHRTLADEWHPDSRLNAGLTPRGVTSGDGELRWWLCNRGHPFRRETNVRAREDSGCPVCANKVARTGVNDLKTLDEEMAAEWHPTRNGQLLASLIVPGYKESVWWHPACGHEFERSPALRQADRRCQVCVDRRVFPGQNDFATLNSELVKELDEYDVADALDEGRWQHSARATAAAAVASTLTLPILNLVTNASGGPGTVVVYLHR